MGKHNFNPAFPFDPYNYVMYSKTPIYRGVWGQGNIRGKSGSAVNRGFVWFTLRMFSPIGERKWPRYIGVCGKSGRGKSGFYCNRRFYSLQSFKNNLKFI